MVNVAMPGAGATTQAIPTMAASATRSARRSPFVFGAANTHSKNNEMHAILHKVMYWSHEQRLDNENLTICFKLVFARFFSCFFQLLKLTISVFKVSISIVPGFVKTQLTVSL